MGKINLELIGMPRIIESYLKHLLFYLQTFFHTLEFVEKNQKKYISEFETITTLAKNIYIEKMIYMTI